MISPALCLEIIVVIRVLRMGISSRGALWALRRKLVRGWYRLAKHGSTACAENGVGVQPHLFSSLHDVFAAVRPKTRTSPRWN